ncbi:MAG: hypothetical protein R3212_06730, partial [Xanthomonadales bacterium]|nr:hypothetical protein [Xanthomonadales bacterium]
HAFDASDGTITWSGVAAPSYTTLSGEYCLRAAISNHRSRFDDFDLMVEKVVQIGRALHSA